MKNARCWVWLAEVLFGASVALALGPVVKEAKPLPVALGMSTADVEAKLGKPQETASTPDGTAVWKYQAKDTRVEISFDRGRVARILQAAVGDDAKEIQGTWKVVSVTIEAKPEPSPTTAFAIGGAKMTPLDGPQRGDNGQYRLDSTMSPKAIDIVQPKGKLSLGIYSLAGDDLKMCLAEPGGARPTKLESKAGSGTVLVVFKRQSREWKHPAAAKPIGKEKAAVEAKAPNGAAEKRAQVRIAKTQIHVIETALHWYRLYWGDYPAPLEVLLQPDKTFEGRLLGGA